VKYDLVFGTKTLVYPDPIGSVIFDPELETVVLDKAI
jgi:hypothetical protein